MSLSAESSRIRPGLLYGGFAALLGCNVLTLVCLLMSPDIAALLGGRNEQIVAAYEDRIAQLRVEVDRLHSRQYAQAGDINLQLQELTQQQEVLLEQQQLVRQLADRAAELGIVTAALPLPADASQGGAVRGPVPTGATAADELASVGRSMAGMMDEGRLALAALSEAATRSTEAIVGELNGIGIVTRLPEAGATGGPWLPAVDSADPSGMIDDANAVFAALARYRAARDAIDTAPVHRPIADSARQSSGYGNRRDPFTKNRAFHSGLDFAAPKGTAVLSAGFGTVTFVGQRSGYGNVVEVTHGTGLLTRYGHLSAFLVKEGQSVNTGTPIARVGSTGRSTGPHLHFEVRRKDVAIDPAKFLAAGKRLQQFLGA